MTEQEFNEKLTEEQRKAMRDLQSQSSIAWDDFLLQAMAPTPLCPYVAIPNFHGIYVGIEKDGYTHS